LNQSVESILNHSTANFDLLLITDEDTKELIERQPFVKRIVPKYLLTSTPEDGVEASKNKVNIFDYTDIDNYSKILFLDCDIVAIKDISIIFNQELDQSLLYSARNLNIDYHHHKSFYHGFEFLGNDLVNEMEKIKQLPFNAGQFLFVNSNQMRNHFQNVQWFMKNWAGEYFFEQCFMNYYFCKAEMTDYTVLQESTAITSTCVNNEYNITESTCLIHFIAPPLNAIAKLDFITEFLIKLNNE
jgi:lipopolysaccharide biosynthesis glycosyltransferase